ncbi:hypothetical protein HFO38_29575 [Rhizobium leguminosarum]|uniref:I78 family peptidase inhibitor n=1 Tax=Rhizobium leguminosarum TaxID=384 RepID=UPI001C982563|nr:I78 family peptidase inhibitor [Rhizobium leguminosarum]MBY5706822.1 hypothetical protein [Rhizobium leguminosarum]
MLKLIPVLVVGLFSVLASCSGHASTAPTNERCNADAAQSLIGKPKPTNVEATQITNSKTVRQIEPGQMVTHDFREDRVTIETDPASRLVVGAKCG